jgi:tRNA-dihydrouridine synthase A
MKAAVGVPVTVKCRIGIADQDPEAALDALAVAAVAAGVDALIVHARKAWLQGLSPRENRDVPPLDYARVYRLKQRHPALPVVLNGGIDNGAGGGASRPRRRCHDGACRLQGAGDCGRRSAVTLRRRTPGARGGRAMIPYIEREIAAGVRLNHRSPHARPVHGAPGGRLCRHLATAAVRPGAGAEVLREALSLVADGGAFAGSAAA